MPLLSRVAILAAADSAVSDSAPDLLHEYLFLFTPADDPYRADWTTSPDVTLLGELLFGDPQPLLYFGVTEPPPPADGVSLSTLHGQIVGRIFSGARIPLIRSMEWSWSPMGGCGEGEVSFVSLEGLNLQLHRTRLAISVGGVRYYEGLITDGPLAVQGNAGFADDRNREGYTFELRGGAALLEEIPHENTGPPRPPNAGPITVPEEQLLIGGAIDYGVAFLDVVRRLVPDAIRVNETRIDTHTGALLIDTIDLSRAGGLAKLLQFLAEGARAYWGVDEYGQIYLEPRSEKILRILYAGRDFQSWTPRYNFDKLYNRVHVRHKEVTTTGGAAAIPGAWAEDRTSVRQYGRKALDVLLPGHFPASVMQPLANALLEDHKDPAISAEIKGIPFEPRKSFYRNGRVRIVGAPAPHLVSVQDFESLAGIVGDLETGLDTETAYSGAVSLRVQWPAESRGKSVLAPLPCDTDAFPRSLFVWVAAEVAATRIIVGCGAAGGFETQVAVAIELANLFKRVEIDLTALRYRTLRFLSITVAEDTAGRVYLDSAGIVRAGYRSYDLAVQRVRYRWQPGEKSHSIEAGTTRRQWAQPLMNVLNVAEQLRLATSKD